MGGCVGLGHRVDWFVDVEPVGGEEGPAAPLPGEMLVMAHFRPGLLEGMLQGFRAAHIPPVALKAMLTDTNAAWTAPALYAEIAKEHAAMHSGGRAHKA